MAVAMFVVGICFMGPVVRLLPPVRHGVDSEPAPLLGMQSIPTQTQNPHKDPRNHLSGIEMARLSNLGRSSLGWQKKLGTT